MKRGRPSKFTLEELAVAYECRCEGASWWVLSKCFGGGIKDAVHWVKRNGIHR